jgi:UDP-N-acetylglucosamine:LPS N-acetylglucosamine transferase
MVSSVGGHLTELLALLPALRDHDDFWVINDRSPVLPAEARAYRIVHAERSPLVAWNALECAAIFARERPDAMVSTGASPAVSAAVAARLAGVPVVFIEPSSQIRRPSVTARFMEWAATERFVQHEALLPALKRFRFAGRL